MLRQRPQNMIQKLPDEHNPLAVLHRVEQFLNGLAPKLRLQHVVKILFAQKIQPVAADSSQQRVQQPRRKRPVYRVIDRAGSPSATPFPLDAPSAPQSSARST